MKRSKIVKALGGAVIGFAVLTGADASANQHSGTGAPGQGDMMMEHGMMGRGMLRMPQMDPARGRKLFASKGCVACHSVNGVGGKDASPLDATGMDRLMNPFECSAKMWRGAEAMIYLQREELGEQIEFTGDELADIIAFTHHPDEQKKFSEADIPSRIRELIEHGHGEDNDDHAKKEKKDHED